MELEGWNERYRSGDRAKDWEAAPNPLVVQTCAGMPPGRALDLACGSGRNSIWLAERGWKVTAVDGAASAIEILRQRASELGVTVDARVADLEKDEFEIEESCWDLVAMCFYLQRSLFERAKRGVQPGGLVLAIVHIVESGEEATEHRLMPGELKQYFSDCEILHYYEGKSRDAAHKRPVAEIVARPATREERRRSSLKLPR
jgi:SAM-dependent methyltransferase